MTDKEKTGNKFGGQVGNMREDFNPPTDEKRAFEQKHLKAFLRGDTIFYKGRTPEGKPHPHPVLRVS